MTKFNLSKMAQKKGFKNYNTMLEENNEKMGFTTEGDSKNINLSLPVKDQVAIDTLEKQIDANRDGKDSLKVTEKAINENEKVYNDRRVSNPEGISSINLASEAYDIKHNEAYKKAEDKEKNETEFWDKYLGTEIQGEKTTVHNNVTKTQLENAPDRFKGLDTDVNKVINYKVPKMVQASLRDADAMLFHIYASARKENRELSAQEKQMVIDINSGKDRYLREYQNV